MKHYHSDFFKRLKKVSLLSILLRKVEEVFPKRDNYNKAAAMNILCDNYSRRLNFKLSINSLKTPFHIGTLLYPLIAYIIGAILLNIHEVKSLIPSNITF